MTIEFSHEVQVTVSQEGDFLWALIERHGARTIERSQHQYLTREGAYVEGMKALHELTRSIARVQGQQKVCRHLRLVSSRA